MSVSRIYHWAQIQPTRPALIYNDAIIDYALFAKAIANVQAVLERQSLPAGTVAVVLVSHLADAWVVVLALRNLGLTTIHARSLDEAKGLALKNWSCVVTAAAEEPTHHLAGNALPGIRTVVLPRLNPASIRSAALPLPSETIGRTGGHILYTSGTTGASKKILWDGDLEDARSLARSRIYGFDQNAMVHNQGFGLWTGTGWKFGLPVWHAGGCLVLDQRREKFKLFFRHKITFANMTTAVFKSLVAEADEWSGCQIWVGGAATAADLVDKAIAKFGPNIHLHYTSTETLSYVLSSRVAGPDDVLWLAPAADRTVRIVDEAGAECLPGQEGDLGILVSELDSRGYLDDDETTAKFFRNGFFYPGDRAVKRADGRVRILGRTGDVLNIHGEKLAIGPIEQRIQEYLQVDEACVFSKQNDAGQNELVIAIQSENEPAKEKLDQVREEFKMFEKVRISLLREFPRTRTGLEKVDRIALRQLLF